MDETEIIMENITCTWTIYSTKLIKDPDKIYELFAKSKFVINGTYLWSAYLTLRKGDTFCSISIKINKKCLRENSVYIKSFEIGKSIDKSFLHLPLGAQNMKENIVVIQHFIDRSELIYNVMGANAISHQYTCPLTITFWVNFTFDKVQKCKVSSINGLNCIFNNKQFSDIKVIVGSEEFYLYKGILTSESPVFAAMFEHEMKEKKENIVEISDIDHELAKAMCYFMYTGKVNNIEDIAAELLPVADKYEINNLKMYCEETLIDSLVVDNVIVFLILADKYRAEELKKRSVLFFKRNVREIIKTENYKANFDSLLHVLPEIIKTLANAYD